MYGVTDRRHDKILAVAEFAAIAAPVIDHAGLPSAAISVMGPIGLLDDAASGKPARLLTASTAQLRSRLDGEAISRTCATGLSCYFVFDIQIGPLRAAPLCFSARESKPHVTS